MAREQSTIGSFQNYGPREPNVGVPNEISKSGLIREEEIYFTFTHANDGLPSFNAAVDAAVSQIPANSFIKEGLLHVTTAFASTGSATLELGFESLTAGTVDANGLDSIAVSLLSDESWHVFDGADIAAAISVDAQVSIDNATATFTAGAGRVILRYIPPTNG